MAVLRPGMMASSARNRQQLMLRLLLSACCLTMAHAQTTLFSEDFEDSSAGDIAGTDDTDDISWTATGALDDMGSSVNENGVSFTDAFQVGQLDDFFTLAPAGCDRTVRGNVLGATDTDGRATLEAIVDTTGCFLVTVSFNYVLSLPYVADSGASKFECFTSCPGTCTRPEDNPVPLSSIETGARGGCNNCWDFISYSLGTTQAETVVIGNDCRDGQCQQITSVGCASPFNENGEAPLGTDETGTTFSLNVVNWANDETSLIDDIQLMCYTEEQATAARLTAPLNCFPPPMTEAPSSMPSTQPSTTPSQAPTSMPSTAPSTSAQPTQGKGKKSSSGGGGKSSSSRFVGGPSNASGKGGKGGSATGTEALPKTKNSKSGAGASQAASLKGKSSSRK